MDLAGIVASIEGSGLGEWMRGSVKAVPIVEAVHVMAVALLFGTIFIVDLRLLGFPNTRRSFTRISDELLHMTWGAFIVAAITGVLMFAANATTYFNNTPFRWKMLMLLGAGMNMAVFQFLTFRGVSSWDKNVPTPAAARVAGLLSIALWVSVIVFGRWIGFTKGYNFDIPEGLELDFEF